jgi:cell division cycle 20-like protein 1, cofactor of APC complex
MAVDEANKTYENLLRTELFDDSISRGTGTPATPARKSIFNFSTRSGHPTPHSLPRSQRGPNLNPHSELYSLSPIKRSSQSMLLEPRKQPRAVSKVPYKVLDAPELADDFYLNLVDWGSTGTLGVGLGNCVYMWNADTGRVSKLCELQDDTVTSVSWIQRVSSFPCGLCVNKIQSNSDTGFTSCYWHKSWLCSNMGRQRYKKVKNNDRTYRKSWRTGLE